MTTDPEDDKHDRGPTPEAQKDEVPDRQVTRVDDEHKARQRKRSIAIAVSLALFALLFYVITLVKMGGGDGN